MRIQDLKGHRAVVTGASSGIGEAYARHLAGRGADLVIAARRVERLQQLAVELAGEHGVEIDVLRCDLCEPGAAYQLFEKATASPKPVTMLINNAGAGAFGRFLDSPVNRHLDTIRLNISALTELCHLFSQHMLHHAKPSYIANIASIAGFQGVTNFAVYSGTKAYVRSFSEILRRELKGTNIGVTCVCPGGTLTEFSVANGQELKASAAQFMMTAEAVVMHGMDAMLARRAFSIPGLINKVACFIPRLLPTGLSLTIAQFAMDSNTRPMVADQSSKSKS